MSGWNQQFQSPGIEDLLAELSPEHRKAVAHVRDWVGEHLSDRPVLTYYHASWGWAEQYQPEADDLTGVYLIPQPGLPRVAICCGRTFFEEHRISELPKHIQAAVRAGVCVGRFVWVECPATTDAEAAAVCEFMALMSGSAQDV